MDLRAEVQKLVDSFPLQGTKDGNAQVDAIFHELNSKLAPEEKKEAGKILRELMQERRTAIRKKRTDINVKEKLKGIEGMISLSYIAENYFGKDRTWLYQRINSSLVNGKPAAFTEEELRIFSDALKDIGSRISETSSIFN